ncbi:phospholipase A2 [Bombyx mori]
MDYEDLGSEIETDKCCRSHDHCIDHIAAGETKHNLTNTAFYSRLHCACDEEFRRCLRLAETETSRKVKEIYFKILKTQCYKKDYPIIGCKYHQWLSGRCLEYELDTNGEQFHQWFDVIDEE